MNIIFGIFLGILISIPFLFKLNAILGMFYILVGGLYGFCLNKYLGRERKKRHREMFEKYSDYMIKEDVG